MTLLAPFFSIGKTLITLYLADRFQWLIFQCITTGIIRGGLTIWKLGHCPRARGQ
ncbi:unnamed protein product [Staurois parvus]|uniref:Uncharacterized protein n=1 Tax=Staurois parvus TaxID=386267 RepID=A0ABN9FME2_9NEOB|nr:unnamed protein product [Staurois parvus]